MLKKSAGFGSTCLEINKPHKSASKSDKHHLEKSKINPLNLTIIGNIEKSYLSDKYLFIASKNQLQRLTYQQNGEDQIIYENLKCLTLSTSSKPNIELTDFVIINNKIFVLNPVKKYILAWDGEQTDIYLYDQNLTLANLTIDQTGNIYASETTSILQLNISKDKVTTNDISKLSFLKNEFFVKNNLLSYKLKRISVKKVIKSFQSETLHMIKRFMMSKSLCITLLSS